MTIVHATRQASIEEITSEMDRRGSVIESLEATLSARDSEIRKLREALEKIERAPAWGFPDKWETTPAEVRQIARAALKEQSHA